MSNTIYILHVLKGDPSKYEGQFCFSTCINEFVNNYCGHFEGGKWISDDLDDDIMYYIDEFNTYGIYPPDIIIDLIQWLNTNMLWSPWMNNFSQIAILKRYVSEATS